MNNRDLPDLLSWIGVTSTIAGPNEWANRRGDRGGGQGHKDEHHFRQNQIDTRSIDCTYTLSVFSEV